MGLDQKVILIRGGTGSSAMCGTASVPACEYNPFEAIQTNVMGAKNVIDAAIDRAVKEVLMVRTIKRSPSPPTRLTPATTWNVSTPP